MKTTCVAIFLLSFCSVASAQSSIEFSPDGAYLTAPIRKILGQARAIEFNLAASSVGFTAKETRALVAGLREGKLSFVGVPENGSSNYPGLVRTKLKITTPLGTVFTTTEPQVGLIARTIHMIPTPYFFQRFATIHIVVIPAPPRDYKVVINGETCRTTEASTYKVYPGKAVVSVTRPPKPPCTWAGPVSSGQVQDVDCKL